MLHVVGASMQLTQEAKEDLRNLEWSYTVAANVKNGLGTFSSQQRQIEAPNRYLVLFERDFN
jgi:hypothetical protein